MGLGQTRLAADLHYEEVHHCEVNVTFMYDIIYEYIIRIRNYDIYRILDCFCCWRVESPRATPPPKKIPHRRGIKPECGYLWGDKTSKMVGGYFAQKSCEESLSTLLATLTILRPCISEAWKKE
jgi:hypothetical protein